MGVSDKGLMFLDYAALSSKPEKVITLGRQHCGCSDRFLREAVGVEARDLYIDSLFIAKYGVKVVHSLDASPYEGSTYVVDLNKPIPETLKSVYDLVVDGGTLEHVFNVAQSFRNAADLCKVGGTIVHILPANNECGHGFYQFSPEFFFSIYSERNGFGETEVYLSEEGNNENPFFRVSKPENGQRVEIKGGDLNYVYVKTKKMSDCGEWISQQSDYEYAWESSAKRRGGTQSGDL